MQLLHAVGASGVQPGGPSRVLFSQRLWQSPHHNHPHEIRLRSISATCMSSAIVVVVVVVIVVIVLKCVSRAKWIQS